ncbi:glutamate racemase [Magnetospirillum sulfuroxidans]|uniref:Glutamate racemase n=1 Tax=Magnetospirillum sulfuroxidans TaxID=611300 RepID=A0ABS5IA16_9PROT|nr:glutamate racemase [Magnetospirillum sulfuroxidans]
MNTLDIIGRNRPIGVFDSGVGGLTVAAALRRRLPAESMLYLGDVARLPYGTKAPQTIIQYALRAAKFFMTSNIKMMVLACNTASAHAAAALAQHYPDLLVLGVIDSGAEQAAALSPRGRIVVAATEGTCRSGAFDRAITAHRPQAEIHPVPCPLFVALVEEGLTEGPIAEAMIRQYLGAYFEGATAADCLVLGCTHFPLLHASLRKVLGPAPVLVDCAEAVAERAAAMLTQQGLLATGAGRIDLFTTDAASRFSASAGRFFPGLGDAPMVELVDL